MVWALLWSNFYPGELYKDHSHGLYFRARYLSERGLECHRFYRCRFVDTRADYRVFLLLGNQLTFVTHFEIIQASESHENDPKSAKIDRRFDSFSKRADECDRLYHISPHAFQHPWTDTICRHPQLYLPSNRHSDFRCADMGKS